jgi:hypothetical protein
MSESLPQHHRPDEQWSNLAAELAVDELFAGKLITQADFSRRIMAQQRAAVDICTRKGRCVIMLPGCVAWTPMVIKDTPSEVYSMLEADAPEVGGIILAAAVAIQCDGLVGNHTASTIA